jgi:hypothetical protein
MLIGKTALTKAHVVCDGQRGEPRIGNTYEGRNIQNKGSMAGSPLQPKPLD